MSPLSAYLRKCNWWTRSALHKASKGLMKTGRSPGILRIEGIKTATGHPWPSLFNAALCSFMLRPHERAGMTAAAEKQNGHGNVRPWPWGVCARLRSASTPPQARGARVQLSKLDGVLNFSHMTCASFLAIDWCDNNTNVCIWQIQHSLQSGRLECCANDGLCLALNAFKVVLTRKALSVDLVDLLGAGGTCGEPARLGYHF